MKNIYTTKINIERRWRNKRTWLGDKVIYCWKTQPYPRSRQIRSSIENMVYTTQQLCNNTKGSRHIEEDLHIAYRVTTRTTGFTNGQKNLWCRYLYTDEKRLLLLRMSYWRKFSARIICDYTDENFLSLYVPEERTSNFWVSMTWATGNVHQYRWLKNGT